ncbi:MAG TPA: universal stress protein, partial [Burkholderiales bacterium]|nr:universal stress protein [Burkholderiales bacterium]
ASAPRSAQAWPRAEAPLQWMQKNRRGEAMKILLAVDGSRPSLDAVACVIRHADWYREKPVVELLTVHLPVPKLPSLGAAVGKAALQRYYDEEGEASLAAAKRKLDAAGIEYRAQVLVGDIAESIVKQAKATRCELIVIGSRGRTGVGSLLGSTAMKVLHLSDLPVLLAK